MAQVEDLKILLKVQDAGGTQVIEKLQNQLRGLERAASKASKSGIDEVARSVRSFDSSGKKNIETLRAQVTSMKALREQAVIGSSQFKSLTKDVERYSNALRKAEGRKASGGGLGGLAKGAGAIAAGGVFGGAEGAIGGAIGLIGGPQGAAVGAAIGAQVGMFRQQLGGLAEYSADLAKQRLALQLVTKDADEYQRALGFISKTSKELAIPQDILTRQFTKLSASVIGAGGNVQDAEKAFIGVASGIRGTGGSLQDLESALIATSQVFSKGKVSAEELRQQIGERLPGAFTLFAESLGMTPAELDKALEGGKVSLQDFQTFAEKLFTEYGVSAKVLADSPMAAGDRLKTALSNLSDTVGSLLAPIGAAFQSTFADIANAINGAAQAFINFFGLTKAGQMERLTRDIGVTVERLTAFDKRRAELVKRGADTTYVDSQIKMFRDRLDKATDEYYTLQKIENAIATGQKEKPSGLPKAQPTGGGGTGRKDITKAQADAQIAAIRNAERGVTLTREAIKNEAEKARIAAQSLPAQRQRVELEKITVKEKNAYTKLAEQEKRANEKAIADKISLNKLQLDLNELLVKGGESAGTISKEEAKQLMTQIKVNEGMIKYQALVDAGIIKAEELEAALKKAYAALAGEEGEGEKFKDFQDAFKAGVEDMGKIVENLGSAAANVFTGLADNVHEFVMTGKANFGEFARSILSDLSKIFIRFAMFSILKSINPFGIFAADGAVVAKNGIVPFAKGGIVNKPTLFQYAQGGVGNYGLMGEAGPEAILPLRRGSNGKLGVESSGGGMGNVVVNVDAGRSSAQGDDKKSTELGKALGAAVKAELIKQKRPGGILAG